MKSPLLLALALASIAASAADAPVAPLRADHPFLGAWQITRRDDACAEIYRVDRSGRTLITSADEVAQSTFTMSDQPSAKGYYKWVDTLVKDNGKKDCWGQITKPGKTTTRYVLMNPAANRFIVCTAEDGRSAWARSSNSKAETSEMAWDDPSPRQRGNARAPRAANPGYSDPSGADGGGVPLTTILGRSLAALLAGVVVYVAVHAILGAWHGHGGTHAWADKGIALTVAIIAAALFIRHLSDPAAWRPSDGFGWLGGRQRRAWDDDYNRRYPTLGEQVAADVVEGAIEGVMRAID